MLRAIVPACLIAASALITTASADPRGPRSGGFAPSAVRFDRAQAPRDRFRPLPLRAGFATDLVWGDRLVVQASPPAPREPRRVRPLSVSPVDAGAVVSRTPSGRVFIGPAPGAYVASPEEVAYYSRRAAPYAPPSFQMIGGASDRDMGAPVRLTYGVQPSRRFNPGPKVVWLDGRGQGAAEGEAGEDSPHVRHLR